MAGASDDDVPRGAATTGHGEHPDGDTTAAVASALDGLPSVATDDDDERTVRKPFDAKLRASSPDLGPELLGAPASLVANAGRVPPGATPKAWTSGLSVPPLVLPGVIQIRLMPDDEDSNEETQVQPVPSAATASPATARSPLPAAGTPVGPPLAAEATDTVQTSVPIEIERLDDDAPKSSQDAPRSKPIPAAGRRPDEDAAVLASSPPDEDTYEADESVTTRGPPVALYGDEITSESPVTRPRPLASTGDDTESVTTRGPRPSGPSTTTTPGSDVDDESAVSETAVLFSPLAPSPSLALPPVPSPPTAGRAVIVSGRAGAGLAVATADLREVVSDSGLRLTQDALPSDQVSAGVPISSGVVRHRERGSDRVPSFRPAPRAFDSPFDRFEDRYGTGPIASGHPRSDRPAFGESGRPPKYDVVVAGVALISFAIPFGLFLYLYDPGSKEEAPRSATEVAHERVTRGDPPRAKMTKGAPQPSALAEPAPSLSSSAGGNKVPPILRRH